MVKEVRHLCFIANYTKTDTFHETARRLEQQGAKVFWIVVNEPIRRYLSRYYPEGRILYVNRKCAETPGEKVSEFKINELVLGDRVLSLNPEEGRKYLLNIQKPIYEFLKNNEITHVFGELTWAHELLIRRITERCDELKCRYLNPHTVRIPNGRFAFFTDEAQSEMLEISGDNAMTAPPAVEVEKPDYLALNDRIVRKARSFSGRVLKLKRFITEENIDPEDPTLINKRWLRFRIRCREEINKEMYRFVRRVRLADIGERKYVFVALHKQPEASIDVIGRYYEDQYQNIVNIWRILPDDWLLLVKEHTNAIGDRDLRFYRRVGRLPNAMILDEREDSHAVIQKSELVVTVSGTVAYEAALMGKKAVTLAPAFFNRLPNCRRIGIDDLAQFRDIEELIDSIPSETETAEAYVLHNSFPGVISDPLSNARSIDPENVRKVAEAIMKVTAG